MTPQALVDDAGELERGEMRSLRSSLHKRCDRPNTFFPSRT
ncbi:hypothetical protein [Chroococcidiopsis sp. CCALA 051]|nr:hypothetical protein [Chroococcidiopsis sp. CCALA 051]